MPPRRTDLREHLVTTAADMIAENPAGLTVRAIAKRAGVADGLLYNHFTDKEELLAAALTMHVRNVESGLHELPEPGTKTLEENLASHLEYGLALHKAILPGFAAFLGQPAVLERLERTGHGGHWRDRLAAYLKAEQDLGRVKDHADTATATALIVGICHETVLSGLLSHSPTTKHPDVDKIVQTVLDGIR
ncbi:TetR/AcrR family transcriptional regulator [Kibdelosporangium persicum]|uniref:DNA-binding transcriptional regulator, AcrR family n=1 Tax=Kibdelosporangium persicum TaxID=2698649 RepID=A0ABX2EVR5_9PSEU|nr:TetR/AcrR family transcriptional regulator [Kibdelosporangium persicum]NRN63111.1 DNA-binding transcriptional regulator, AcrR family [Kibdelosporangium persicum]